MSGEFVRAGKFVIMKVLDCLLFKRAVFVASPRYVMRTSSFLYRVKLGILLVGRRFRIPESALEYLKAL